MVSLIRALCWKPYLSEEAATSLKQYKYAGGDSGIIYRFLYNPLAMKLVQYMPVYVAPNFITLAGFIFTVIPFALLFGLFGPYFD